MKAAVNLVGWLAVATLGGWLARWAVSQPSGMGNGPLTVTLGTILLLVWMTGAIVVWWYPWLAAGAFASAAVLTLFPGHALPVPTLLMAVSAALAVWSLLADLMSTLHRSGQSPADTDNDRTVRPAEEQPVPPQRCVICQGPTDEIICAACAGALGSQAAAWLQDLSSEPPAPLRKCNHASPDERSTRDNPTFDPLDG